jgi:hypothetical protein
VLQESCINTFLHNGADQKKFVLVLPLHGEMFELKYPETGVVFEKYTKQLNSIFPFLSPRNTWDYNEVRFSSISGREIE